MGELGPPAALIELARPRIPALTLVFAAVVGDCIDARRFSALAKAAMSTYDLGSKCDIEADARDALDLPETLLPTDSLDGILRSFGAGAVERGREDMPGVAPALRLRLRWCPMGKLEELERGLNASSVAEGGLGLKASRGRPNGGVGYETPSGMGAASYVI